MLKYTLLFLTFPLVYSSAECWSCATRNLEENWSKGPNAMKEAPLNFTDSCGDPADISALQTVECNQGPCFSRTFMKKGVKSAIRGCWNRMIKEDAPKAKNYCNFDETSHQLQCVCTGNQCNIKQCYNCKTKNANDDIKPMRIPPSLSTCDTNPKKGSTITCTSYCVTLQDGKNSSDQHKIIRGCWDLLFGEVPPANKVNKCVNSGDKNICLCNSNVCNDQLCQCNIQNRILSSNILLILLLFFIYILNIFYK